jgi:predicted ATPase
MKTKWHVITGAPSSGKTTLINSLGGRGFYTFPEIARVYIDQEILKGRTIHEIRKDENSFQNKLFDLKFEFESKLDPRSKVFLDVGLPESMAYFKLHNLDMTRIKSLLHQNYASVFLLDPLPLDKDYARIETRSDVLKIYKTIEQVYKELGYRVIKVPADTVDNRIKLILENL